MLIVTAETLLGERWIDFADEWKRTNRNTTVNFEYLGYMTLPDESRPIWEERLYHAYADRIERQIGLGRLAALLRDAFVELNTSPGVRPAFWSNVDNVHNEIIQALQAVDDIHHQY